MSKHALQIKLDQLNIKIQQAQEERATFLQEYYETIVEKLKVVDAHVLPLDILVGAVLDAIQKYNAADGVIKKWEGMAHPFFRPKRPSRSKAVASKHPPKYNPSREAEINTDAKQKESMDE